MYWIWVHEQKWSIRASWYLKRLSLSQKKKKKSFFYNFFLMLISNNLIDEKQRIYLNKLSQEELFKQAITTMEKWFHDAAYCFIELNGRATEKN